MPLPLSTFEAAVLQALFDDPDAPSTLSEAAPGDFQAIERTLTGLGFITDVLEMKGRTFAREVSLRWGSGWTARVIVSGEILGFVVFVDDGRVTGIEGFVYSEDDWPALGAFEVIRDAQS